MNITRYVSPIKRRDACPVADITRHYGLAHWWTATVTVGSLWWLGRATRVVSPLCVVKKNDITRQRVSTCPTRHPALGTTPTFLPNFRISTAVLASAPLFWRAVLWIIYWLVVIVSGSRTLPSYESAAVRLSAGLSAITSQLALWLYDNCGFLVTFAVTSGKIILSKTMSSETVVTSSQPQSETEGRIGTCTVIAVSSCRQRGRLRKVFISVHPVRSDGRRVACLVLPYT